MKIFVYKFIAVFISLSLVFIVAEIFLRYLVEPFSRGVNVGYFNKKFSELNYLYDENGFRNPKIIANADVLLLGDSFTFGSGLEVKKTYSNILYEKFNMDKKLNLYNLGKSSTNTKDQLKILKDYDVKNKSKVVYQYYYNDIDYLYNKKSLILNDNYLKKNITKSFIYLANKSALFDFIFSPLAIKLFYRNSKVNFDEKIFVNHIYDIKKIFNFAHDKEVQVIFLIMPILINTYTFDFSNKTYINYLKINFNKVCNKGDVLLDIAENLKKNLTPLDWKINNYNAHASEKTNKLIANELYKIIYENNKTEALICGN